MWKHRLQTNPKTNGNKGRPISPFSSSATPESSPQMSSTSSSPKTETPLPSGVRYIRSSPTSIYNSITPITPTRPSPKKRLRFGNDLISTQPRSPKSITGKKTVNAVKTNGVKTSYVNKKSSEATHVVKPVFKQGFIDKLNTNSKPSPRNDIKTVALSPASRSRSPIFSTVDFSSDKKHDSTDSTPKSIPLSSSGDSKESPIVSPFQTESTIEIMTSDGLVKRSLKMGKNSGPNSHRNSLSVPKSYVFLKNSDENSIAVNVNVAVGLDCNDICHKRSDNKFSNDDERDSDNIDGNTAEDMDGDHMLDQVLGHSSPFFVVVRMRPFLESEIESHNDVLVVDMKDNTVNIINSIKYKSLEFEFDLCLNSSDKDLFDFADADTVYRKMGEPLLERSLEGYNVCLFTYGQTGSGKTYSMMGSETVAGIIPRFINELYKKIMSFPKNSIVVEISYFEIYNEQIYDLLTDQKIHQKLRIREHPQNGPYVEDLSKHLVMSCSDVMELLASGSRRRATAPTTANDQSSRSHSILTIYLEKSLFKKDDELVLDDDSSCKSKINLIDLAGSERVSHTGSDGERLKESNLINKSLLTLGKVIKQLADISKSNKTPKTVHVPYRESALTWLLKQSLGGNSRTSMIATISPAKCHLEETISTLRYAATAKDIINYVHINEDPKSKLIKQLREEVNTLKAQIGSVNTNTKVETMTKETETSFDCGNSYIELDSILGEQEVLEEKQNQLLNELIDLKETNQLMLESIPEERSDSEFLDKIHRMFDDILNQ